MECQKDFSKGQRSQSKQQTKASKVQVKLNLIGKTCDLAQVLR